MAIYVTIDHFNQVNIKTFPDNGRLNWEGPFEGISDVEGRSGKNIFMSRSAENTPKSYKTPLVAVQFDFSNNNAKNVNALFHCFMFDRNMEIETKKQASGVVKLAARINT